MPNEVSAPFPLGADRGGAVHYYQDANGLWWLVRDAVEHEGRFFQVPVGRTDIASHRVFTWSPAPGVQGLDKARRDTGRGKNPESERTLRLLGRFADARAALFVFPELASRALTDEALAAQLRAAEPRSVILESAKP